MIQPCALMHRFTHRERHTQLRLGLLRVQALQDELPGSSGLTRSVHDAARRVAALSGEVQCAAGAARELGPKLCQF